MRVKLYHQCYNQGSHCTGKTGKIVKSNSRQGKHREFENFGKRQGKHREFENFRMILNSNSHLHSCAVGRDCCKGTCRPKYNYRLCYFIYKIHREQYKFNRENTGNLNWKMELEPCYNLFGPPHSIFVLPHAKLAL